MKDGHFKTLNNNFIQFSSKRRMHIGSKNNRNKIGNEKLNILVKKKNE